MKKLTPTTQELEVRDKVIARVLKATRENTPILLPDFDPTTERPSDAFALLMVGIEPNPYGGTLGPYRYQFEGEEDLLHLIVTHKNQHPLTAEEAQSVVSFLYPNVPPALMWFKPGIQSHHIYLGHDILLEYLR